MRIQRSCLLLSLRGSATVKRHAVPMRLSNSYTQTSTVIKKVVNSQQQHPQLETARPTRRSLMAEHANKIIDGTALAK